jgi:triosephosphate isomerase (TIM)
MSSRQRLIAGNWKMHKTIGESVAFVEALLRLQPRLHGVDAVVCPPFTALAAVHSALGDHRIGLGAQTMAAADHGAFTGQISPLMLLDCGVRWVILGHSEQRMYCGETDAAVNAKVGAALYHGLTPIVAVGETEEEHVAGRTRERVTAQARAAFAGCSPDDVVRCVVAYEPIWAIGTGRSCDPAGADAVMAEIAAAVPGLDRTRMLYGGSVKPDNLAAFIAQPHIDGGLVGGASLDPDSFAELLAIAGAVPR